MMGGNDGLGGLVISGTGPSCQDFSDERETEMVENALAAKTLEEIVSIWTDAKKGCSAELKETIEVILKSVLDLEIIMAKNDFEKLIEIANKLSYYWYEFEEIITALIKTAPNLESLKNVFGVKKEDYRYQFKCCSFQYKPEHLQCLFIEKWLGFLKMSESREDGFQILVDLFQLSEDSIREFIFKKYLELDLSEKELETCYNIINEKVSLYDGLKTTKIFSTIIHKWFDVAGSVETARKLYRMYYGTSVQISAEKMAEKLSSL